MDSFFRTTGSSPPPQCQVDASGHDPRPHAEGISPLPEELVKGLAALLAAALVNDIRQYPDLRDLMLSSVSPSGTTDAVVPSPEPDSLPQQSEDHRRSSTRSTARRSAHAPSDQRVHSAS